MLWLTLLIGCGQSETGINGDDTDTWQTPAQDPEVWDADHDGTPDADDCEPDDPDIHPGAEELCNDVDDDCSGEVDDGDYDEDDDGFVSHACRGVVDDEALDCDDHAATTYPDAPELCNGIDDDCDEFVDEDDADGDGVLACDDCDDHDGYVFPDAAEACDGIDNNCDGQIDEIWDFDGDGYSACQGDCDDGDEDVSPAALERCDGEDQDCDGLVDEDFDVDGDGSATCFGDCDDGDARVYPNAEEVCDGVDNDCNAATDERADIDGDGVSICGGDCDDASAAAYPGAAESCDGIDNDCNSYWDELASCWSCTTSGTHALCTTGAAWSDAKQVCEGMGGWLAIVDNSSENTTITGIVTTPAWIGASDEDEDGTWEWVDGSTMYYDEWSSTEPDGSGDCAVINTSGRRGEWGDLSCSTEKQFVCEF